MDHGTLAKRRKSSIVDEDREECRRLRKIQSRFFVQQNILYCSRCDPFLSGLEIDAMQIANGKVTLDQKIISTVLFGHETEKTW